MLLVAGLLAGPGCLLDLPAPPAAPTAPELTGIEPESAFADEVVAISGQRFSAEVAENEILFQRGSARAEGFDAAGRLLVRVPEDAQDGPIVVANRYGRSAPFGRLRYKGLGHPRWGKIASQVQIGHSPAGLAMIRGELYLLSMFLRSVVSWQGRLIDLPELPWSMVALPEEHKLLVGTQSGLWLVDLGTPRPELHAVELPLALWARFLDRFTEGDGARAWVAGYDGEGKVCSLEIDLATVAMVPGTLREHELVQLFGAAVQADGRWLVLLGGREVSGQDRFGLIVLDRRQPDHHRWVAGPGGVLLDGAVGLTGDAAFVPAAGHGLLKLDLASPEASWTVIPTRVAQMAVEVVIAEVGGHPMVLVVNSRPGQLLAVHPQDGLQWAIPLGKEPSAAAGLDPARPVLYVADNLENSVSAIDLESARQVGWSSFAFDLGDMSGAQAGAAQGLALDVQDGRSEVLVASRRYHALVRIDASSLIAQEALRLSSRTPPVALGRNDAPGDGALWVLLENELGRFAPGATELEIVQDGLPGPGQRLAFAGEAVLVGMRSHLGVWRPSTGFAAGPSLGDSFLELLAPQPGGKVVAVWTEAVGWDWYGRAALWDVDGLVHQKPPLQDLRDTFRSALCYGAAVLRGRPALFLDMGGVAAEHDYRAVQLGPDLDPLPPQPSSVTGWGPEGVAPDGRFLFWRDIFRAATVLRYSRIGESGSVTDLTMTMLPGIESGGVVFSPTGEQAFTPVSGTDAVIVLE